jgi:hypothetical protein
MSARVALRMARAAGVELALDGNDLSLKAASEPSATVLETLRRHKTEIVAMLRSGRDGWSAEDWRLYLEERAAVAEFDGELPCDEAEAQVLEYSIVEWLDLNPAPSAPGHCAWCGGSEGPIVPFGTEPGTHVWLHAQCWTEWQKMRRSQAKEALTRMCQGSDELNGYDRANIG